jgi:hypothetical protein
MERVISTTSHPAKPQYALPCVIDALLEPPTLVFLFEGLIEYGQHSGTQERKVVCHDRIKMLPF